MPSTDAQALQALGGSSINNQLVDQHENTFGCGEHSQQGQLLRRTSSAALIVEESMRRALGGGIAGASAMSIQVAVLMWMRTTVEYQYRYGSSTSSVMRTLYRQGGVGRFYQGFFPALLQAALSRFGDTAANTGTLTYLNSNRSTQELPTSVKTLASASAASFWRVGLMPLDTVRSMLQVEGATGLAMLRAKIKVHGWPVVFHGSNGMIAYAFVGHYLWYGTFNVLDTSMPRKTSDTKFMLCRNAAVGFCSSAVSDSMTNSLRVVKTYRQTSQTAISYSDAARSVIKSDGMMGLFGRGLGMRLFANGIQAAFFSAMWKYFEQRFV
ncbi:MAG: hypothetical protein SGPRY_012294 [Prymnesium sp.]